MPERAREIAFQIQAQRLRTRRAPIRNRASRLTHRRPRPAPLLAELVNSLTPTQLCDAAARALTPTSSALVTSRCNFDNFIIKSIISSGDVIIK
ncbi:unnamed protein product [Arctia plantaginis]|uniref:Uncharacterized protein n=1 Tax=Arctia plantaginis TaxID=874455 RepID=A0A8S1B7B1_ARCPL|nr:unnamed protein product [Arctia plantaginis]